MTEFEDASIKQKIRVRKQPKLTSLSEFDGIQILGVAEEENQKPKKSTEKNETTLSDEESLQKEIEDSKKGRMKSGKFWKKEFNTK